MAKPAGSSGRPKYPKQVLSIMPQREKDIIVLRATGFTYAAIAKHFGVTRERIRQIERKAHRRAWMIWHVDGTPIMCRVAVNGRRCPQGHVAVEGADGELHVVNWKGERVDVPHGARVTFGEEAMCALPGGPE